MALRLPLAEQNESLRRLAASLATNSRRILHRRALTKRPNLAKSRKNSRRAPFTFSSRSVFVFLARSVLSSKPFVDSSGRTATTLLPHLINTPIQLYTVICDKHSSFNDILRFLFYSYALPFHDNQKQEWLYPLIHRKWFYFSHNSSTDSYLF